MRNTCGIYTTVHIYHSGTPTEGLHSSFLKLFLLENLSYAPTIAHPHCAGFFFLQVPYIYNEFKQVIVKINLNQFKGMLFGDKGFVSAAHPLSLKGASASRYLFYCFVNFYLHFISWIKKKKDVYNHLSLWCVFYMFKKWWENVNFFFNSNDSLP